MIARWILSAFGLGAPVLRDDPDVTRAMRRMKAAAFQHRRISTRAHAAALDIIDQQEADERPGEMLRAADATRSTIETMLRRMT